VVTRSSGPVAIDSVSLGTGSDDSAPPDEREPSVVSETGQQRLGRYRLCFELASGGMATVFLARAEGPGGFEKLVALKRIHPHLAKQRAFVEMFLDEARIASRISHPNVCSVIDFGEARGTYFLTMEYLVGEPLSRVLRALSRGPRELRKRLPAFAARIVADAAEGMHAAHELRDERGHPLRVVHRDISPHNLFLTYDGAVRVVDFGIASAENRIHETSVGSVKGKHAYMAPEQLRGNKVDRRADVWALGVVLWELLTLDRLFRRGTAPETISAVASEAAPPPSLVADEVPEELDAIVLRALARDPADRTPSARHLARDLEAFLAARSESVGLSDLAEWLDALFPGGHERKLQLARIASQSRDVPIVDESVLESSVAGPAPGANANAKAQSRRWLRVTTAAVATAVLAVGSFLLGSAMQRDPPARRARVAIPRAAVAPPAIPAQAPPSSRSSPAPAQQQPPVDPEARTAGDGPRRPRRRADPGAVNVVTPGGWAEIRVAGRRRGQSPVQISLPAGRHVIELRPQGHRRIRHVTVTVRPGETTRVVVPIDR